MAPLYTKVMVYAFKTPVDTVYCPARTPGLYLGGYTVLKRLFKPISLERMVLSGRWRHVWQDVLLWSIVAVVAAWQVPQWIPQGPQAIILRFKDSSELSPGSSVRLMGKEVGWVQKVKFKKDHVQVKLRFYRDSPIIPPRSEFTIEFTGIAGAKCIEITPPQSVLVSTLNHRGKALNAHFNGRQDANHYVVVEPIRMADVQQGGLLQVDAMMEGSENMARFLDPDGQSTAVNLAAHRQFLKQIDLDLATGVTNLAGARQIAQQTGNSLDTTSTEIATTLNNYSSSLGQLNTRPITEAPEELPRQLKRIKKANQTLIKLKEGAKLQKPDLTLAPKTLEPLVKTSQQTLPQVTLGLQQVACIACETDKALPDVKQKIRQAAITMARLKTRLQGLAEPPAQITEP
jgi:MlaD protein